MLETPRSRRFQIHLTTAIVLMFVAGALIWANVTEQVVQVTKFNYIQTLATEYGWPFKAFRIDELRWLFAQSAKEHSSECYMPAYLMGALDLFIALLSLFSVWYACEWLIRRRSSRKDA